jgi:hypothetical protein
MSFGVLLPSIYWELPIVILLVSLVYSATRFDDWRSILGETWRWGRNMAVFLLAIAVVLYLISFLT